jgi:hypothetical protein
MRALATMLMLGGAGVAALVPAQSDPTRETLSPSELAQSAPVSAAAPRLDVPAPEAVPLLEWSDIVDRPCRRLGRPVRVRVQVESHPTDWNAYLTRFGTGQFEALQGWADDQFPWLKSDFDAPQVRVFVRKGSAAARALAGAKTYSRFELFGTVREVFLDLPWIEVTDARPMTDVITEATVIHAARAIELIHEGAWRLARLEIDQALEAPLPTSATLELARLREQCVDQEPDNDTPNVPPR